MPSVPMEVEREFADELEHEASAWMHAYVHELREKTGEPGREYDDNVSSLDDDTNEIRIDVKGFTESEHPRTDDGKFGPGGGGSSGKPHEHVTSWAEHVKKLPAKVASKARSYVKSKYDKLESRYGRKTAIAIMAAGVIGVPLPVPGSSLITAAPVIAAAELYRWYNSKGTELSEDEIKKIGAAWIRHLLANWDAGV